MKHFKPLIIYLSILSIITLAIFANNPIKVYAEVPADQLVISHVGTLTGLPYPFDYSLTGRYFTVTDSTGIPVSTALSPKYFITDDNTTFYALDSKDVFRIILNKGIGIATSAQFFEDLWSRWYSIQLTPAYNLKLQGALYDDTNDNFLGFCINDISSCYYSEHEPTSVRIPSELTNDVYNFYNYYINNESNAPDYFNYVCPTDTSIATYWNVNNQSYHQDWEEGRIANYEVVKAQYDNCLNFKIGIDPSSKDIQNNRTWYGNGAATFNFCDSNGTAYINTNNTTWVNFCNDYNITKDNNNFSFSELATITDQKDLTYSLEYRVYDTLTLNEKDTYSYVMNTDANNPNLSYTTGISPFYLGNATGTQPSALFYSRALNTPTGGNITIYKDTTTYNSIHVDKTYTNNSYKSTIYYNYNPQNDNSFTVSKTTIDNSTTINQTIYDDSNDIFIDNVDNGGNIEVPPTNITVIINNIIPDYTEPDPDDPSGGGGGSGGSGDDDINDDNVLSALLAAIRHFFKIIGQLIGTILTGLLEVINAILESITGIMESMSGVTDFISALFSWIPEPVPQVLGLAISITILCALIRFIRG